MTTSTIEDTQQVRWDLSILYSDINDSHLDSDLSDLATMAKRFADPGEPLPQFWQRRFHDFNVWGHKKKTEKLDYMHMNPVKRALVAGPKDWPWSSYSFYVNGNRGLIRIDSL